MPPSGSFMRRRHGRARPCEQMGSAPVLVLVAFAWQQFVVDLVTLVTSILLGGASCSNNYVQLGA